MARHRANYPVHARGRTAGYATQLFIRRHRAAIAVAALLAVVIVGGIAAVLWQAAAANLNPWTEDKVDTKNPDRGPLLLLSGELDHTVPWAIVNASYKQQQDNPGVTEIEKIPGHGHALTIDSGWRDVADKALTFVQRFT